MSYSNPIDKIRKLIEQRDEIERQIQLEVQKEQDRYKFSWMNFLIVMTIFIGIPLMFYLNDLIFPATSIWSWRYYGK